MEWIKTILDNHKKEDGTLDFDAAMDEINKEFPKNAVPKDVYNQKADDLNAANKLMDDLKKTNKDTEDLQKKITDYESQVEQLQTEREAERKEYAIKERLTKEGVTDVDYIKYKLGDVEMDKDGNLVDLDNKLKELKEANPTFFASQDDKKDNTNTNGAGYTPIDNKLDNGKPSDPTADATAAFEAALGIKSE